MRNNAFNKPKAVLIFDKAYLLIAVTRSLHSAADLTGGNLQSISFCCTGRYASSGGFYFRHIHPDIEVEMSDLGTLLLQEYDEMCGEKRIYYTVKQMVHKRTLLNKKKRNGNQKEKKNE